MNKYNEYLNKEIRVISVVVYKNGRIIKTEYFGTLIKEYNDSIIIIEKDGKEIKIRKRFIKRVDTNV